MPVWSVPAAIRAARAAIVMPGLFAIADKVIGNPQIALFAAFGSFATLFSRASPGAAVRSWPRTSDWPWPEAFC